MAERPLVLCFHSFSSSAAQFDPLARRLAPGFTVRAADLQGHGTRAAWSGAREFMLADEAPPFEALLSGDGEVHLVGHSYGAAVALRVAERHRARVRSMALYEPAIWGTLVHLLPAEPATREIEAVRDETIGFVDAGCFDAAAARFIDYWSGVGTWASLPDHKRPRLVATVRALRAAWIASFVDRWNTESLQSLDIPCLLLTGRRSTAAARRAIGLLRDLLPIATMVEFDDLGHLGPVTHPDKVDAAVEAFLLSHNPRQHGYR